MDIVSPRLGLAGRTCWQAVRRPSRDRAAPDPRSFARARSRRSRSAGCSSAGPRGDAQPPTPGRRAAPRCAAPPTGSRPRSTGLEEPLRALPARARGRRRSRAARGTAGRAPPSSSTGRRCSTRAGVDVPPARVAQAYLELAVLVRALEGLDRLGPDRTRRRARVALGRALRPAREPARPRARRPPRACRVGPRDRLAAWPRSSPSSARSTSTSSRAWSGCRGRARPSPDATLRARSGRQGREPGGRRGAARRRGDDDRLRRLATPSPTRRSRGCATAGVDLDACAGRRRPDRRRADHRRRAPARTRSSSRPARTLGLRPDDVVAARGRGVLCQLEIPDAAVVARGRARARALLPERGAGAAGPRRRPT